MTLSKLDRFRFRSSSLVAVKGPRAICFDSTFIEYFVPVFTVMVRSETDKVWRSVSLFRSFNVNFGDVKSFVLRQADWDEIAWRTDCGMGGVPNAYLEVKYVSVAAQQATEVKSAIDVALSEYVSCNLGSKAVASSVSSTSESNVICTYSVDLYDRIDIRVAWMGPPYQQVDQAIAKMTHCTDMLASMPIERYSLSSFESNVVDCRPNEIDKVILQMARGDFG